MKVGPFRRARCVVLLWLVLQSGALVSINAQVSPGPLSRVHADLDSNLKCLECHDAGRGSASLDQHCLDCHQGIAWLVEQERGLHGREAQENCTGCHPEHGGRDFELIEWTEGAAERFDHRRAGLPLEGKHADLKCAECHRFDRQIPSIVKLMKRKDRTKGWLGLDRNCLACHRDRHQGTLSAQCESCHGFDGWKPAPTFDHNQSSYPLTGKHSDVACDKCHLVPGKIQQIGEKGERIPLYKPVAYQECSDCHKDPHVGQLGPQCSSCHVTDAFNKVDSQKFNHSKTRYPLVGRHKDLACDKCHDPQKAWGKKPPFEKCGSCHKDAHAGTATRNGKEVDCASCHDERGFKPSLYRVVDHDKSNYPLEGKHRDVACVECHPKNPPGVPRKSLGTAAVLIRPSYAHCRDCHKDAHGGQLTDRKHGGACESCHRVSGWKPSTYGVDEHAKLRLALEGRHAEVECQACHGPSRNGLPPLTEANAPGKTRVALTTLDSECKSCHYDPHERRFAESGERSKEQGCRACHNLAHFRPATVDASTHGEFRFALKDAHGAVPCIACHDELKLPASTVRLLDSTGSERRLPFVVQHERCDSCHETPHGDQFEGRARGQGCEVCDDQQAFRPASRFDHDRDSAFPLGGGHRNVTCEQCHPTRVEDSGRKRVVYIPIPYECRDCHGKRIPDPSAGPS